MHWLRRVATLLLVALFVLVSSVVVILFNFQQVLSNPDSIKKAVEGRRLLDEAVSVLVRQELQNQPIFRDFPVLIRNSPALAEVLDGLVTDEWANAQSEQVVDAIFRYLESGDLSELTISLEVAPIWSELRGDTGRRIVVASLESLPVCTIDQLPNLDLSTGQLDITVCMPPLVPVELVASELHAILTGIIDEKTATFILGERLEFNLIDLDPAPRADSIRVVQDFRLFYRLSRIGVWFSLLIPVFVLLLILFLNVRSFSDAGLWSGGALLLVSLSTFLTAIAVRALLPGFILGNGPSLATGDVAGHVIDRIVRVILTGLLQQWQRRLFIESGVAFAAGVLLFVMGSLAYLFTRRDRTGHNG